MTAAGIAAGALVVAIGAVFRPRPVRTPEPTVGAADVAARDRDAGSVFGRLGAGVGRLLGHDVGPQSIRARQVGAALTIAPLCVIAPVPGVILMIAGVCWPIVEARKAKQRCERQLLDELPEIVDLLGVAVAGGRTVALAIDDLTALVSGSLCDELGLCRRRAVMGRRLADELEQLPDRHGELIRPLVRALVSAERYGSSIGPSLEAAAVDVRMLRRRDAEQQARKLPIKMLFPLVVCVLPAFGMLTVVPIVVDAFATLRP